MRERGPEVADVFRSYGVAYLEACGPTSTSQRRVLRAISVCRTAALGGHKRRCDLCGHEEISYNSCRDRHCPKCQAAARAQWLEAREKELLDLPYFHVVFTLPQSLGPLALQNKQLVYGLLFRAVSETLLTIAKDPKHLGADVGFLSVLHTWGQNLHHHPHVHCVVPGGGISPDGMQWISSRKNFFLPVRVLSRLFRKKFLGLLTAAYSTGKLSLHGTLEHLREPQNWSEWIATLTATEWVVYAKPPFGGASLVLKYLARYTHRVAISNQRLLSLEDGKVTFLWRDYAHGNCQKTMSLDAVEFIRRFLLHVLPTGFMHIRHYGFLANRGRKQKLALIRKLLAQKTDKHALASETPAHKLAGTAQEVHPDLCPACKEGRLLLVETLDPLGLAGFDPLKFNTS
ncbi:MAG: IS91 family transposase [Candidatus Eisenbacteria bacterium]|nr:IS91 family transposase [Candidatus Eisenbacteria bacterium]